MKKTALQGRSDSCGSVGDPELGEGVGEVGLDRCFTDVQRTPNLQLSGGQRLGGGDAGLADVTVLRFALGCSSSRHQR